MESTLKPESLLNNKTHGLVSSTFEKVWPKEKPFTGECPGVNVEL